MNKCILIALCAVAVFAAVNGAPQDLYTDKYDNVDLDNILSSKRLIRSYMGCIKGAAPCTPEGSYLAQVLPEALQTECAKCNEKQKAAAVKAIKKIAGDYPEEWAEIQAKFDPTGELYNKFKAANL